MVTEETKRGREWDGSVVLVFKWGLTVWVLEVLRGGLAGAGQVIPMS